MKITIRKSCDAGKLIKKYFEVTSEDVRGCEIEVALVIPWDRCVSKESQKEESIKFEMTDSRKETLEILKVCTGKILEELLSEIKSSSD